MEKNVLQHFRPEEAPFIEKVEGWFTLVHERGRRRLTDFLDPRQGEILRQLAAHYGGIQILEDGGYDGAERRRFLLLPEEEEPDFQLAYLLIRPKGRFHSLDHRDYLGALLSLGVIRDKFGDLWTHEDGAYLVLAAEIADFVRLQLTSVGKASVEVEMKEREEIPFPVEEWTEKMITTASLRLDAVLAELIPLSRAKTVELIRAGRVKRNFRQTEKPDEEIKPGDSLSVRGYGRFRILEEMGTTKKGKYSLRVGLPSR